MYVRIDGKYHATLTMIINSTIVEIGVHRVDSVYEMWLGTESGEHL